MFELEKAITEWRQQMLAAGIKTPVPLEELECHLREEIERQVQTGTSDQEAFQRTVVQIGQAKELKTEFAKAGNFLILLGVDKFRSIIRILGIVWLVLCSLGFFRQSGANIWVLTHDRPGLHFFTGLLFLAIYGFGIFGSVLAIRGAQVGRWVVGTIAGFLALFSVAVLLHMIPTAYPHSVVKVCVLTAFYAITALLMFLPSYSNFKPATK